jgi:hypothetical protein
VNLIELVRAMRGTNSEINGADQTLSDPNRRVTASASIGFGNIGQALAKAHSA